MQQSKRQMYTTEEHDIPKYDKSY